MRTWRIASHVLRQNRWLVILLALWPCAITAILLLPKGKVDIGDIQVLLQQEAIYGVALAAFQAGALLRNEQRSRRIIQILACSVSRGEYLFALLLATVLPLVLYLAGFLVSGYFLASAADLPMTAIYYFAGLILIIGTWVGCAALLLSIFMPTLLASTGSLLLLGGLFWAGLPPYELLMLAASISLKGQHISYDIYQLEDIIITPIEIIILFLVAWILFSRRDLNLTSE
jgi:hypothetical protein